MPRHQRTRWIVTTTALDNGEIVAYGPYYDYDKAHKLSERMARGSEHYHGDDNTFGAYTVQLTTLKPWRGMKAFKEGY